MPVIGGNPGTGGGGGGTDAGALQKINNLGDLNNFLAARQNLGMPVYNPKDYGVVDGTSASDAAYQQAINLASAQPFGGIVYAPYKAALANPLILKSGVHLVLGVNERQTGLGTTFGGQLVPTGSFSSNAWLVDTPSTAIYNASVIGGSIAGTPPTSTSSPRWGGIRIQNGNYITIGGTAIAGMSLQPLYLVNGVGCQIENLGTQQFTKYRTLTAHEGSVDIGGTDHTIRHCQCNGGDNSQVYFPGNYYRNGFLLRGNTCWVYDVNGEYADCGWRVTGKDNRLYGIRGDVNAGRGGTIDGIINQFFGCLFFANSNDVFVTGLRGTHDALYLSTLALGNVIDGVAADTISAVATTGSPLAGQTVTATSRYIVNDQSNAGSSPIAFADAVNRISNVVAPVNTYEVDKISTALSGTYFAIAKPHQGQPRFRMPSRWSSGNTSADTTNHRSAYSDGSYWRDQTTNLIVGNRMDPDSAVPRETSLWSPYNGTSVANSSGTTPIGNGEGGSANKANNLYGGVPQVYVVKANSTGVTAGGMGSISFIFPVEAANVYILGTTCRGVGKAMTLTPSITWYDAAHSTGTGSGISTTTLAGQGVPNNTPSERIFSPIIAPGGAVVARVLFMFTVTGLAVNDTAEFTQNFLALTHDGTNAIDYATTTYLNP